MAAESGAQAGTAGKLDGKPAPAPALSPDQLRQAFRSELADAALMMRFNLTLGDRS